MTGPFFVVGTPRSGTTLTAEILGRHSAVFMSAENHFFEDIYARRRELGDPADPQARESLICRLQSIYGRYNQVEFQAQIDAAWADQSVVERLRQAGSTYPRLLDEFYRIQMSPGQLTWGNQTPKDIFHVEEILACFPTARFFVCVRDVRDFLHSYKSRWRVTTEAHTDRLRALYHPVTTSLLWRATMRRLGEIRRSLPDGSMMIVRYEDLVANPQRIVRGMCEMAGLEFEAEMLRISSHNSSMSSHGTGIFSSSVGTWREGLSPEEVAIAESLTKADLHELGYVLESLSSSPLRRAAIWASFPNAMVRALVANRQNRGPLIPYLAKRGLSIIKSA